MRFSGAQSWRASIGMAHALVVALHIRDAAVLDVFSSAPADVDVPPLEPSVALDPALTSHATAEVAAAWSAWWESLLDRHSEFDGVPPLVVDGFPPLDVDLRALIDIGLPAADAWFAADKRREIETLRDMGRRPARGVGTELGGIVREVEAGLGRAAAPFNLLISVLPVAGPWGRRVRRDHVLISRALADDGVGLRLLLEPVVRELALEP